MSDHDPALILTRESAELIHGDGRTVVVQLAKWHEPRTVSDDGGATSYREAFESLTFADRVRVVETHHGETIGHADLESYRADPEPTIDLHIAETTAGNDALALIRNGTIGGVSIEFRPKLTDRLVDGIVRRTDALVQGIAFAFRPAHTAPILATREQPTNEGPTTMSEVTEQPAGITPDDLASFGDEMRREMIEQFSIVGNAEKPDPFAKLRKFRNLSEFALAAYDDPDTYDPRQLNRALVDQITSASPGVIPPAWLSTVYGIIDRGRPTISAFGTEALPPSGMAVEWPFYDGDFTALVAAQATEKTEIESVLVPIEKGSEDLATYAGGSDVSLQLVRRSSPSYLQAYQSILTIGYAATTDAAANAVALAAATAGTVWVPATGTADELKDSLFRASVAVEAATGSPAEFAVVATDVFLAIGVLDGLNPAPYSVQNTPGTADAASLQVNVSGLPIVHDQYAAAGSFIVSNSLAGNWYEDGPLTVQAPDVAKLGVDFAVWGMGAFAAVLPAGIISVPAA